MPDRPFLSTREAADRLGKDISWIAYLCRSGQLSGAFKVNPEAQTSAWFVPVEALDAYKSESSKSASKKAKEPGK